MTQTAARLADFKSDVYSQAGEDGVIEAILDVLPDHDRWCVEFGAWDGLHLSNSRNLIKHKDYSAVLIEGDAARCAQLKRNYADNDRVIGVNRFVGFTATDGLDAILAETQIPRDFDVLGIDIDGNDYHVWKAVNNYRPKLVCIEFNPTIPTEVSFVQQANPETSQGCSLRALVELGREKDYELVCVLALNAFFVPREYFDLFNIDDNRPETLRTDLSAVTWLFSGYDGHVFLRGSCRLPWHGLRLDEARVQHLPDQMQRFPSGYSAAERLKLKLQRMFSPDRLRGRSDNNRS